jgi:uncharacterized protein YkvS
MVLQSSGAISLSNIQTEFGGTNPISISEYYAAAAGVPSSGAIDFSDFYGKSSTPAPATGRGLFAGGYNTPTPTTSITYNIIDYVTISTAGNATDFGDLTVGRRYISGCSSSTRAVFGGGQATTVVINNIDYVTIATTGNAIDFGDLTGATRYGYGSFSNSTRGVFGSGQSVTPAVVVLNVIDYVTIATTGNATDFGDLTLARSAASGCSSPTRGVFSGGFVSPIAYNIIDYVTIATTGNAIDFGDLTAARSIISSCSSSTRGVFGGGGYLNIIDYVTIATTGNATDFGDLSGDRVGAAAPSNSTRGVFGGGATFITPAIIYINTIEYITIATTGNAIDFGDLSITRGDLAGCSDSHGGLDGGGGGGGGIGRGVFAGGGILPSTVLNTIEYITIATTGNSTDFGDLTVARNVAACSSSTRGAFAGGAVGAAPTTTYYNNIDYITIATTGNAIDFGDLTVTRSGSRACSSSTRGVFGGGFSPTLYLNTIDYITIATTGNTIDFGDLTAARTGLSACSSSTRGIFSGGNAAAPAITPATFYNTIEYITIATTGNATDFGDMLTRRTSLSACSSSTRGLFAGGTSPSPIANVYYNIIEYITIATTGNATDFGDLTVPRGYFGACSSSTRGVFAGGYDILSPVVTYNTIDYITIATTGNATDFGDLSALIYSLDGCSDSHGGLA